MPGAFLGMNSSQPDTHARDWFAHVLGSKPLVSREEYLQSIHAEKNACSTQQADSCLLKALETGILRVSACSERGRRQKKSHQDDHGDRIGVTFQCLSFGSQRASEAFVQRDGCVVIDHGNAMSLQCTGMLYQQSNARISGTYEYTAQGNHSASWQALVDAHPKLGFEMQQTSETGDVETTIDVGPVALGTCVEYTMTQLGKFQKARMYRKHHTCMSSSLSFSAAPTGTQDRTMKAQIFKKKKHHSGTTAQKSGLHGKQHWFPQIDLAYTQLSSSVPLSRKVWKLDHVGCTQSLACLSSSGRSQSQASVTFYGGTRRKTMMSLSHACLNDSLLLTLSSEMASRQPSCTLKARHTKNKDHRTTYQVSWQPTKAKEVVRLSIKTKAKGLSFSIQASPGDVRATFYHDWQ